MKIFQMVVHQEGRFGLFNTIFMEGNVTSTEKTENKKTFPYSQFACIYFNLIHLHF